jgi:hypothetical protein
MTLWEMNQGNFSCVLISKTLFVWNLLHETNIMQLVSSVYDPHPQSSARAESYLLWLLLLVSNCFANYQGNLQYHAKRDL